MDRFPTLKTGAAIQYPSRREIRCKAAVLRFVDGAEQRIPESGITRRRWLIPLNRLDSAELEAVEQLFVSAQGRSGSFAFTDPYDGTEYPDCSFEQDEFVFRQKDEGRGEAVLSLRENRVTS